MFLLHSLESLIFNSSVARWHIQTIWDHNTTLTLKCEEHSISSLHISSKGFLHCIATGVKGKCINFNSCKVFLKGFLTRLFVQILILVYGYFQKKTSRCGGVWVCISEFGILECKFGLLMWTEGSCKSVAKFIFRCQTNIVANLNCLILL